MRKIKKAPTTAEVSGHDENGRNEEKSQSVQAERKQEEVKTTVLSFDEFFLQQTTVMSNTGAFNRKHHPEWHYQGCNKACKDCDEKEQSPQEIYQLLLKEYKK